MSAWNWFDSITGVLGNIGSNIANFKYNKWLNEKTWEREDNAVQRRVADLEAAGLNKNLAAGSAASSSSPTSLGFDFEGTDFGSASQKGANKKLTDEQIKLAEQNTENAKLTGQQIEGNIAKTEADTAATLQAIENAKRDGNIKDWNLTLARFQGMPYGTAGSGLQSAVNQIWTQLGKKGYVGGFYEGQPVAMVNPAGLSPDMVPTQVDGVPDDFAEEFARHWRETHPKYY